MVNYPLSRGLGNIAKVYLITCSQSTCAKLKKYGFYPVGHGGITHILCSILYTVYTIYGIHCKYIYTVYNIHYTLLNFTIVIGFYF